ncbi:Type 1 glutamine amidotransferase-like domain-containing protein [Rossellomorea aquimaris]|uniref:Type 1 glutamine amidotransferase-like domain-containing protein n=1 Tax=Bacillaceae TaxID=186817 RepID=UPI0011EEB525|nr:Type 1 glutamine amidotransferase-like domain-containing protein [Bacillus sp. CH30_1T]KAA0560473.1 peptidase E [Bacillus sp. CH30_1T]
MINIFLSGGGNEEQTEMIDKEFVKAIDHNKPLLYIPIAMQGEIPYEDCYKWIHSVFNPLGITEIEMWTDLEAKSLEDLRKFSSIYIGGGNTFYLLNTLRETGFDEILKEYTDKKGIVYGGSAGAIIFGRDILTVSHMDPNHTNLKTFEGFNYIDNYSLWCHYETSNDDLIKKYVNKYGYSVIALPEETGIVMNEGGLKVIGSSPAYIFRNSDKYVFEPNGEK